MKFIAALEMIYKFKKKNWKTPAISVSNKINQIIKQVLVPSPHISLRSLFKLESNINHNFSIERKCKENEKI